MSFLLEETRSQRKSREAALAETPLELQSRMRDILSDRPLLRWIIDGLEASGIAGEGPLALTLFLAGTSRLLAKPLAVIVQGPSSSGKSYVIEHVAKLFPAEAVLIATDMTPQALYYLPPGELEHRFIVCGERSRRQNEDTAHATKALREMISSGQLSKLITVTEGDGPRTEYIRQAGPIAYAESTTAPELFEEDANRCLVLHPDERPEQTRRILAAEGRRYSGQAATTDRHQWRDEFQTLQRLLEPLDAVIPFAAELCRQLSEDRLEIRRAVTHVLSLIQASALLHQHQRPRDDLRRVIAQPEDYWLARMLLEPVLVRSLADQPAEALQHFVDQLRRFSGEFTAKKIAAQIKMHERTVREHLNELLSLGVIKQTVHGRGPIPAKWWITSDLQLPDSETRILPTVADVCGVEEETLALPEIPADWGSANLSHVPF